MLYSDRIYLSEGINVVKRNNTNLLLNSKECLICHDCFLIMGSSFEILTVVMIWQYCVGILLTLLLSLLKVKNWNK